MLSTVQSIQSLHLQGLCRHQLKCDGTRWRTGREVKGKMSNALGSQYPSHYLGTCSIQHFYRWCAHPAFQQLTEMTPNGRFKCTRPFGCKDEVWFLRVCHHISKAVYCLQIAWSWGEAVSTCALLSADSWFDVCRELPTTKLRARFSFEKWRVQDSSRGDRGSVTFQGTPIATCWPLWNFRCAKLSHLLPHKHVKYTRVSVRET